MRHLVFQICQFQLWYQEWLLLHFTTCKARIGPKNKSSQNLLKLGIINISNMPFSILMWFFCLFSFFFFSEHTRQAWQCKFLTSGHSSVQTLLEIYDYTSLVVHALIRFFKYKISIHRMDNHLKNTISDSAK